VLNRREETGINQFKSRQATSENQFSLNLISYGIEEISGSFMQSSMICSLLVHNQKTIQTDLRESAFSFYKGELWWM